MTNNPTIDGVSRSLLETIKFWLERAQESTYDSDIDGLAELRTLLDANKVNNREMGLMQFVETHPVAPAVERQEPFAYYFRFAGYVTTEGPQGWRTEIEIEKPAEFLFADGRVKDFTPLYKQTPELAALQSRIDQLEAEALYAAATYQAARARIEEPERGRGEPIYEQRYGGGWINIGRSEYERNLADPEEAPSLRIVFTAPPAPVAVVPDGWKLVPVEPTTEMVESLKARLMVTSRGGILNAGVSLADAIAASPACLDATAALNGGKP